jgi:hypothetical protein
MHYTHYIYEIKTLLKEKEYDRAEELLKLRVDLTETESKRMNFGVTPRYY